MKNDFGMKKISQWIRKKLKPVSLLLESDLERAVRNEEFVFFYQPQIDLKTGQVMGVEALLRWNHPQKGMISPTEFIPMLERTKLIQSLTPFLFRQSAEDLRALQTKGFKNLTMAVNLSTVQLEDDKLASKLSKQLKKSKVNPKHYECEITETAMMENLTRDLRVLQEISDTGVCLAIDDFGTGYAGFNYLRRLNIQKLKIDMEFVSALFEHKNNEIILSAMMELGHRLKLQVLAEGVETKKQEEWLTKNGCDVAQGFYFARPMPFDDLVHFLQQEKECRQKSISDSLVEIEPLKDSEKQIKAPLDGSLAKTQPEKKRMSFIKRGKSR